MRLTNDIRRQILTTAIEFKTKKARAAYAKARAALANRLYEHEFGVVGRRVARLPKDWQDLKDHIYILHPDFSAWNRGDKTSSCFKLSRPRPFPSSSTVSVEDKTHPLFAEAQAVAQMDADLDRERDAIRESVNALTYSVQTSEKLLEAWPEGKRFLPKQVTTVNTAIVAVEAAAKANAVLGLVA